MGRAALLGVLLAGCVEQAPALDYGDPTALSTPTEVDGITGYVVSPKASAAIDKATLRVEVAAYTKDAAPLRVRMGPKGGALGVAEAKGSPGPGQRFSASVTLVHGINVIEVLVDDEGATRFRRLDFQLLYDGRAPGLSIELLAPPAGKSGCDGALPLDGVATSAHEVCVRGRATTARGAKLASVTVQGAEATLGDAGTFEAVVPVDADTDQAIAVAAKDSRGASTQGSVTVTQDSQPPDLAITDPTGAPSFATDDDQITLGGTASDASGLAALRIESDRGSVKSLTPGSPWQGTVLLEPGSNKLSVVAVDRAGNSSSRLIDVVRGRVIRLGPPQGSQSATKLSLDRTQLAALLSADDQKKLKAATVPLRPAIEASLRAIREPEKYGVDTSLWGQPEKNLSRLLGMSPDNADLKGTSIEKLLGLGAAVGLPPARLLADLLGVPVTEPFLTIDRVASVVLTNSVATHPNATLDDKGEPVLEISLYDVFQDLHTLSDRFGPAGEHPGFLDGPVEAKVLEPGFLMGLPVKTNLRQYDGVDASASSKSSLFRLEGDKVLELDFSSDAFSVVGLADEPAVDLRVHIGEDPSFLGAGTTKEANADPLQPGFYKGDGPVWAAKPWLTERLVADAAYQQYATAYQDSGYKKSLSYDAGSIKKAATIDWDRGWVTIVTSGGIGAPPPPQYLWDMILEVAQVRLHDGVAEGAADVAFGLKKVPVGLTADELIQQLKPTLQSQAGELSKLLAGQAGLAASGADFFYVPSAAGGSGFLFFRAAGDSDGAYPYTKPGFFSDAALTQKSSVAAPQAGTDDATHEKIAAQVGAKLFFADDTGVTYQLDVLEASAAGVAVRVANTAGGAK